jgi:hypothetical protein
LAFLLTASSAGSAGETFKVYIPQGSDLQIRNPRGAVSLQTSKKVPAHLSVDYSGKSNWVEFEDSAHEFQSGSCHLTTTEGKSNSFDASLWNGERSDSQFIVESRGFYLQR